MPKAQVIFARSASRHGYTVEDVLYAYEHPRKKRTIHRDGAIYVKLTGGHHGDPLVPSLEVMLKILPGQGILVFHVDAEQPGFWDKA